MVLRKMIFNRVRSPAPGKNRVERPRRGSNIVSKLMILACFSLVLVHSITPQTQIFIHRWPPEGCQDLGTSGDCSGNCCWGSSQIYCETGRYCDIYVRSCEYIEVSGDGTHGSFRWEQEAIIACY